MRSFGPLFFWIYFWSFPPPRSPFWYLHYVFIGHLMMSHLSEALLFFLLLFSLFFALHSVYSSVIKVADSNFCQFKSTVEPLWWILHFSYYSFNSRISMLFYFTISVFLLIFSNGWDIVIIPSFISVSIVSFSSLSIFIMATFKSVLNLTSGHL